MVKANHARVEWIGGRKCWQVTIQVGAEVIRRSCGKTAHDAADPALRDLAGATARDEGYELDPAAVEIVRG